VRTETSAPGGGPTAGPCLFRRVPSETPFCHPRS
jgi:hypothetical protein